MRRRVSLRKTLQQGLRSYAVRTLHGLADGSGSGILSPADIQQVAANAGFSGSDLATAVAIALAESFPSGNPNSYNPESQDVPGRYGRKSANDGLGSFGLWQIYLAGHPEFRGWSLLDPQTNANAAFQVYQQAGGFSPWSTFGNGAYRAYLSKVPGVQAPSDAPVPPLTIDANTGLPIDDSTPTPPFATSGLAPGQIMGLTALALSAYFAADFFFGD